ncbi:MAG: H-type lectin domain-containing protein [Pseudomonadota bacterium]
MSKLQNLRTQLGTKITNNDQPVPVVIHNQRAVRLENNSVVVVGNGQLFRHVDPNGDMWDGFGHRSASAFIPFKKDLPRRPIVTVNLTGIDASHAHNLRVKLEVEEERVTGFIVRAITWDDTKIAGLDVSWTAYC